MTTINELLLLDRPLVGLDLETTGLTDDARIVELSFQVWTTGGMTREWSSCINPEMPIPPGVMDIHGITDENVFGAPTFGLLAPNLATGFSNCDFAGKNVRFDLRILETEMRRVKVPWNYAAAKILDAERLEQIAVPRSLSHLYEKYTGQKLEGAHGSLADITASMIVICRQLEEHRDTLPRDLGKLHELQWPGRIDVEGKFIFRNGSVICTFGKYRQQRIQAIPPDYWRFVLQKDFSAEIKVIAANALLGVYPEVPRDSDQ